MDIQSFFKEKGTVPKRVNIHITRDGGPVRPVAEGGASPSEREIYEMMFFWRSFWRRIRIWMLIGNTRGRFQDIEGRRIKTRYKLFQSILQGKYWIAMSKALCLHA